MGQDEVTQRIIEEGSVSLQESSQNSPAMAAEGQGGAGQLLCSQAPWLAPRGSSWQENSSGGRAGRGGWRARLHQVRVKIPLTTWILC